MIPHSCSESIRLGSRRPSPTSSTTCCHCQGGNKSGKLEGDIDFQEESGKLFPRWSSQSQPELVNIVIRVTLAPMPRRPHAVHRFRPIDLRRYHLLMLPTEKNKGAPYDPSRDHPRRSSRRAPRRPSAPSHCPCISQRYRPHVGPSSRQVLRSWR
jgi:hypothetical protein